MANHCCRASYHLCHDICASWPWSGSAECFLSLGAGFIRGEGWAVKRRRGVVGMDGVMLCSDQRRARWPDPTSSGLGSFLFERSHVMPQSLSNSINKPRGAYRSCTVVYTGAALHLFHARLPTHRCTCLGSLPSRATPPSFSTRSATHVGVTFC
jgi:hypothetical protein